MENLLENLDKIDHQILSILLKDAKVTYAQIAEELSISVSTVHVRVKKLEDLKIINNYTLNIDFSKIGLGLTAFIGFIIDSKRHEEITKDLCKIQEIVDLHHTTGKYHMFAKIICRDSKHLKEILLVKLNNVKGIEKTETMISLGELISTPANLLKH